MVALDLRSRRFAVAVVRMLMAVAVAAVVLPALLFCAVP
tara:strand:- start:359 stop:475 length:117 start_codon:yes stop_codon:yes gene_type:complete